MSSFKTTFLLTPPLYSVEAKLIFLFLFSSLSFSPLEETAFEAGVRVQIHSQAEPPFVHELGFGVAPGFQTFVATQEQRVSEL